MPLELILRFAKAALSSLSLQKVILGGDTNSLMLHFRLYGPLAIVDENGTDRRPKLMKARAILAVLAATPGHRHTRSWFQSMFWSDRQHQQALSSLRSALADIRRGLGPYADVLVTDHSDVSLKQDLIAVNSGDDIRPKATFLEGFDVPHAEGFEDWLRETRARHCAAGTSASRSFAKPISALPSKCDVCQLFLASRADSHPDLTRLQCDALVDCMAKSTEDLGLAEPFDGRGRGETTDDFLSAASHAQCGLTLISETVETSSGSIARLRVLETETARLVWSKSITGAASISLDDPATIGVVAEFVDVLSERLLRPFRWQDSEMPAPLLAVSGMHRIFRLGAQNFEIADEMLKSAHQQEPRGSFLAWRAYLRTLLIGELEFTDKEAIIEEGTVLARRALEKEPHNSMVLALCAQVENMLHNAYGNAFDLSARAIDLNRCNPLAWASLGVAAAFLGQDEKGARIAAKGAKLAAGARYGFVSDALASSACLVAGDLKSARMFAEKGHNKAPNFAPPMRFLSALYCLDGQFESAHQMAVKLRQREPGFSMERLKDEGYPTDSLRRARVLESLPMREI